MGFARFNINWPWRWLLREQAPGTYSVPDLILPTLDVSRFFPGFIQQRAANTNLALGLNQVQIAVPTNRAAMLVTFATFRTTANAGWADVRIQYNQEGFLHELMTYAAATTDLNTPMPIVRSSRVNFGPNQITGLPPLYIQAPNTLDIQINGAAGTEILTTQFSFLELDQHQPVPIALP